MNLLDMRTLVLSNALTNVICVWVALLLWRQSRDRYAGTALWVMLFACQVAALILIALRNAVPDWLSIVVANALVVGGLILGLVGLERFLGKKGARVPHVLLLVIFVAVHGYFTLVQPDLGLRNLNVSVAMLLVAVQCVWLLWHRVDPELRPLTFGVGLVFLLFSLVSAVRIVEYFAVEQAHINYFKQGLVAALILLSYQMLLIGGCPTTPSPRKPA